jgi:hypothetical protein
MWLVLGLLGCGGDDAGDGTTPPTETGDTDTETDTDTDTPTDTEPPLPEYFEVADIFVEARFGVDVATGEVGVVERLNGTFEYPMIEVFLADAEWSGDVQDVAHYCSILLVLERNPVPDWVSDDPRLVWGVDWDPLDPPLTSCNTPGYELNPFDWGLNVITTFTADPSWGVAVGAPTPALVKQLEPVLGGDVVYLLGGTLHVSSLLASAPIENVYGYAYAVDADLKLVDAEGDNLLDPLLASEVHDGGALLSSAWITLSSLTAWSVR